MRLLLAAALLTAPLLAAPPHPAPAAGAAPALREDRLTFLLPDPDGPLLLEVAALAPASAPVDPAALAAAVRAAHPGAIELPAPAARAAYVLDAVRWRDPRIPWWYSPSGAPSALAPAEARNAILRGADAWRFAGRTPVEFLYQGETEAPTGCRGDPNQVPYTRDGRNVLGWGPIEGGYLGYACWWRGTSLVENTPFFELLEFDIVLDPGYPYTPDILQALALHEFGHALGLAHSDACPGAAMCAGADALVHGEPQPDDLAGLVALYGRSPSADLPPRARIPLLARD